MVALDDVWGQIYFQTGWKLEQCFKPSSGTSLKSYTVACCRHQVH